MSAVLSKSVVPSTIQTTLPVPTPIAGVPEEYAYLTIGVPPVARMKSTCSIKA